MDLLTQAQISREFSVDKSLVSRDVKNGKLKPAGESKSGKPLFSREDAAINYSNAYLNNRNINNINSLALKDKKIVVEKVDQRKLERKTLRENVDEKLIVNETDKLLSGFNFDDWLIELFGDDFEEMTDQQKLARSRSVRETRLAAMEDIKLRKEQGSLIERAVVDRECREIGAEITSILHNFPARLSPDLSVMTDQHEIKQYLINEINQLIDRMKAKLAEV